MSNLSQLQYSPEELAQVKLSDMLAANSGVVAADLQVSGSNTGKLTIVPTSQAYSNPAWMYYGHALASYQILDFADVFGAYELRLVLDSPAMASDLAALFSEIFQVKLTANDIIEEPIPPIMVNGQNYLLKAHPKSTMWKGTRWVRLYQTSTNPGS